MVRREAGNGQAPSPAGRFVANWLTGLALACSPIVSFAQNTDIPVGLSAGFTGRTSTSVKQYVEGAQAYFETLNRQGGIAGRKIYLATLDDGHLPELVVENTKRLIEDEKAVALLGYFGDALVNAALPIIKEKRIPLVGAVTGTESHRTQPNLFFVRASYQAEVEKIVTQASSLGLKKFAIFYEDDEFGNAVLAGLQKVLADRKLTLGAKASYERNSTKVSDAVATIAAGTPQSIVMACTLEACTEFVRQMQKRGQVPHFNHLSGVDIASLHKELRELSHGLEVSRVVPLPQAQSVPVVNEYNKSLKAVSPTAQPSLLGMEGFIAAKVLAEGIRRAGPNPTRQGLAIALESMREFDVGGFVVNYTRGSHRGSDFADVTIIGPEGRVKY